MGRTACTEPQCLYKGALYLYFIYHHHHNISVMELGHLLTRSRLTYPEVSTKVCHDSFCQLGNSVSLPCVISYEAFCLHVASSFSYIPVICPKSLLFLIPLQFVYLFLICPNVSCCSSHVFHLCCCYSSDVPCFNPLNAELSPICYLLALLAHHFLHVSKIGVKSLTLRLLMSYIYEAPILDVSRSHTTTQHSR